MHPCRTPLLHGKESVTVFLDSLMQEVALAYIDCNTDSNFLLTPISASRTHSNVWFTLSNAFLKST